ncbi:MAG: hypothetical protein N2688_00185 [Burkholderiaceae bacterium]|nr:hypothetical protein [Burkholderiaceae bacterium]
MDASHLTFWEGAAKSSPAIVMLAIGVILALGGFIKYLMGIIETRHAEIVHMHDQVRKEMVAMNERAMMAIKDNTEALRDLREALREVRH